MKQKKCRAGVSLMSNQVVMPRCCDKLSRLTSGLPLTYNGAGFTLIELLVVVLIIGILAAVALPKYEQAVLKSRMMQVLPYLKAVKNAEEVYYLANGEYTNDMDNLAVEGTAPSGWTFAIPSSAIVAYYQGETNWMITTRFDHNPVWAGITYCYAKAGQTKYEKVCKSMGAPISSGINSEGSRYYVAH